MSRQRPYGTFEEAYILLLNTSNSELYKEFVQQLKGFDELGKQGKTNRMRLPAKFLLNHQEYIPFWQCLSRMYGEIFAEPSESYIYTENISMLIEVLTDLYNRVCDDRIKDHDYNFDY